MRFDKPYLHPLSLPGGDGQAAAAPQQQHLTVHQQRFKAEGFASTVWDSSIVLVSPQGWLPGWWAAAAQRQCLRLRGGAGRTRMDGPVQSSG